MLISNLLQVQQDQRLGLSQIKEDPWFENIDWEEGGKIEEDSKE